MKLHIKNEQWRARHEIPKVNEAAFGRSMRANWLTSWEEKAASLSLVVELGERDGWPLFSRM